MFDASSFDASSAPTAVFSPRHRSCLLTARCRSIAHPALQVYGFAAENKNLWAEHAAGESEHSLQMTELHVKFQESIEGKVTLTLALALVLVPGVNRGQGAPSRTLHGGP